jgi:WD40 repeat protein
VRAGSTIAGRFQVDSEIARGATWAWHRGREETTGVDVSVELLVQTGPGDTDRFAHDAKLLAGLAHPALARQLARGDGYRISEWLPGPTLAERQALSRTEVGAIVRAVAGGLAALHARGIGHAPVEPRDVHIDEDRVQFVPHLAPGSDLRSFGQFLATVLASCTDPPTGLAAFVERLLAGEVGPETLSAEVARLTDDRAATAATLPQGEAGARGTAPSAARATTLGNYVVEGEVARGGLGHILRAYDKRIGRTVAIKELLPDRRGSRERLVREARITGRLEHPGIVPVYDAGAWPDGEPFYAMKLVAGQSLRERIAETRSLGERLALLPHALAVAEAIAFAHSKGVIHRDIKPANVMVGEYGETLVVDWGLAKEVGGSDETPSGPSEPPLDAHETAIGTVVGTPAYMAPEQAAGRRIDARADVYALGALLYELLSGRQPRESTADAPAPLATIVAELPVELAAIVGKAMAPDPDARYPSGRELAEDLKRFTTGQLVAAHRYSPWGLMRRFVRRHRAIVAVAGAALLVLAAGGVLSVQRIVAARNLAEAQRGAAEEQRRVARSAEAEVSARADQLVLGQAALVLEHDPTAALAWLKQYPPSAPDWGRARGLIADAWSRGIARHVLATPRVPDAAAITPDGGQVATGENDGTVRLWDLAAGRSVTLRGHTADIMALAFSSDGKLLASASEDKTVRLWDVAGARQVATVTVAEFARAVAFTPTGDRLALGLQDGSVATWDLASAVVAPIGRHNAPKVTGVAYSPDGKLLASSGLDKTVRLWDASGAEVRAFAAPRTLADVAFAPDGAAVAAIDEQTVHLWTLATGGHVALDRASPTITLAFTGPNAIVFGDGQGDVHVWWPASGDVQTLRGHSNFIERVAVASAAGLMLSSSDDRTVRVWPIPGTRRVLKLPAPASGVPEISPDDRWAASGDYQGHVVLWDLGDGAVRTLTGHRDWVTDFDFSHDGTKLASTDHTTLRLWDLASGRGRVLMTSPRSLDGPSFTADGMLIVADGVDAMLVDAATGAIRCRFPARGVTLAPDGRGFAGVEHGQLYIVDAADCARRYIFDFGEVGEDVAWALFSPNGRQVASVRATDFAVLLLDLDSRQLRVLRGHEGSVRALRFSPDGTLLSSSSADGTVRLWDTATGATRRVLRGHDASVNAARWSPDGQILASSDSLGVIRLWSVDGDEVEVLRGHEKIVRGMRFTRDGRLLVSSGSDGTLRVWPGAMPHVRPNDPAELHDWLGRVTTAVIDADGRLKSP